MLLFRRYVAYSRGAVKSPGPTYRTLATIRTKTRLFLCQGTKVYSQKCLNNSAKDTTPSTIGNVASASQQIANSSWQNGSATDESTKVEKQTKSILLQTALTSLRGIMFVYDMVTFPYFHYMRKNSKMRETGQIRRLNLTDKFVSYERDWCTDNPMLEELIRHKKEDTIFSVLEFAVGKHGDDAKALGTRKVLSEEGQTVSPDGKVLKRLVLGDYEWMSYTELDQAVRNFGRGLRALGHKPGDRIAIYAETRAEWLISALGAFSQNVSIVTIYSTLGESGAVHALKETQVRTVITSHLLQPKFKSMLPQLPHVERLVVMENQLHPIDTVGYSVDIVPHKRVIDKGACLSSDITLSPQPLKGEDTAIIMYTSGSTGVPKGVVLSHKNVISAMKGFSDVIDSDENGMYVAYLPLAHVLELFSECCAICYGMPIGYSSPYTLVDKSPQIIPGHTGDIGILKPTRMCAVPLVMDRIFKAAMDTINRKGPVAKQVFNFCYNYKLSWIQKGYTNSPILDKIVFQQFKKILGGRLKTCVVGGAPYSKETQEFMCVCFGVKTIQGYGLTETGCAGTCTVMEDLSSGTVGGPIPNTEIRLVNWDEAGYTVSDKPHPRGEITIGGDCVADGYLTTTEEDANFFVEDDKRWVKTGDVGMFDENGHLKVIDRKKDLVKLANGKYVSLGKVETEMKISPLVENICVCADPYQEFTVALIIASKAYLKQLADSMNKQNLSVDELYEDTDIVQAATRLLNEHGRKCGLEKFEIPRSLKLISDHMWTPDTGLITESFKLKRKNIANAYENDIKAMYKSSA